MSFSQRIALLFRLPIRAQRLLVRKTHESRPRPDAESGCYPSRGSLAPVKSPGTLVSVALLGCIAVALPSCGPAQSPTGGAAQRPQAAPIEVSLVAVRRAEAIRTVDVTGTLFGDIDTTVAAKVAGRIVRLHVDLGAAVSTGDALAELETRDYELELTQRERTVRVTLSQLGLGEELPAGFEPSMVPSVRQRRSEADNAKAKFDRAQRLFEQKPPLIAEQDLADLRTAWEMAREATEVALLEAQSLVARAAAERAAVEIARQRLHDATIVAPTGEQGEKRQFRVAQRMVSIGELMSIGTPMFSLVATDPIRFRATVPERFSDAIAVGQSAAISLETDSSAPAGAAATTGTVTRIAPRIDERSRSFEVEITLANPDGRLKPGAFARGAIQIRRDANVAFVPSAAVVTFAGVQRVFSVRDGKAVAHRIRTGKEADGLIEVIGELDVTEVVASGAAGLGQDAPVTVRASSPAPSAP